MDNIKLCARLTETLLMTAYKSKIIRFKLDEDLFQLRIYFLAFVESPEMIFPNINKFVKYFYIIQKWRDYIKEFAKKKDIRNLLHPNINVHSRRLIAEFSGDGIKCIEKLQLHCANMNFSEKSRYDRTFQKVTHKGG